MTGWLIDKSALVRLAHTNDSVDWADRIERGLVRVSTVTLLEIGFSARSAEDLRSGFNRPPLARMPVEYLTPHIEDRAVEVQIELAKRGQHRAASIPDLLVAATAELTQLTVLHLAEDFELIAEITHQPLQRVAID